MTGVQLPASSHTAATMSFAARLRDALDSYEICYCQWKGHADPDRWVRGDGDLDLLVARRDAGRLADALSGLGFKRIVPPESKRIPGTESYYGLNPWLQRFVHVHVHYHLRLGDYRTMNYHLPLETVVLASSIPGAPLRVPAPEVEFIVFVVRMVLGYSIVGTIRGREELASPRRTAQWEHFASRVTQDRVREFLSTNLPGLSPALFSRCVRSLSPGCPGLTRLRVKRQLAHAVRARRSLSSDTIRRLGQAVGERLARAVGKHPRQNRLATGGLVVAILGGDGSGKTTAVNELRGWLADGFETRTIHLGKPPRSVATLALAMLRRAMTAIGLGTVTGPLLLLRSVSIARDRYHLYVRACRRSAAGAIVICDRYPTTYIRHMDGPSVHVAAATRRAPHWLVRTLQRWELTYYERILPPDFAVLLRVDPDVAVARKSDEPAEYVRARARAIWSLDVSGTPAHVVDANRAKDDVIADLRSLVWSRL